MRFTPSLTLAFVLAGTCCIAQAQERGLFERLDKDENGFVDESEVGDDAARLFNRLLRTSDENKDGKLSREEFQAGTTQRPDDAPPADSPPADRPPMAFDAAAMLQRLDANSDGKLARDELPERIRPAFERIDANGDGSVDQEEFNRFAQSMRERLPGAQPGAPGAGRPRPEFAIGAMVLKALDADSNGRLSADEISAAAKVLAKFDANGDGQLDREELLKQVPEDLRPLPPAGGAPGRGLTQMLELLKRMDSNGDGKISKEEAPERIKEAFDRLDANSDGQLDAEELRRLGERLRPQ